MMMQKFTSARGARNTKHLVDLFHNRRTLWQMLREAFTGKYKMSVLTNMVFILGIVYVLFPFDLVTDFIPFFGWLDDGLVVFLVVKRLQKETQRYNRSKVMQRRR